MANINAIIVPAKVLKDGRHKVRISVAHNGETRYILTSIIIDSLKEFKNGAVVKRPDATIMNTKLRGILQRNQDEIDNLPYVKGLSCAELVYHLKTFALSKQKSLQNIYEEYMEIANIKKSTEITYYMVWKSISHYVDVNMMVCKFNHNIVLKLDRDLRKRGLRPGTIRIYLTFLRTIIDFAQRCGCVEFKPHPFNGYKPPQKEVRQSWLSVEQLKQIRNVKSSKKNVNKCRDLFMLSYYLGGINMADLININFNEQTDRLRYVRTKCAGQQKINKSVEFRIPVEAKEIIRRYKGDDGYLALTELDRKSKCHSFFLVNMPKLAEEAGVEKLIYYSARKSFAQHAFDLGVSTSVIDYILGHSLNKGGSSLYHYIYVTPEMASEAIRKVLDNLK